MSRPKVIGVIPARLESTRLPGKVLLDVAGKPLLQRVYDAVRESPSLDELLVASDSPRVLDFCEQQGLRWMKTGLHQSGSDRLYEVLLKTDGAIYVNIQGDEPTICETHLELLVRPLLAGKAGVSTLCVRVEEDEAADPNAVKVVCSAVNRALYFSRRPVPYYREPSGARFYFKHIGLYAYSREALGLFHALPAGPLEKAERLEQLRFLEHGIPIAVAETSENTIGVDTPEDLERAIRYFRERETRS